MRQTLEPKLRRRVILSGQGNLFARIKQFLLECWSELKLAQKPMKQEVASYSMAVLVVILALAIYMAILDIIFARIFAFFTR
ncbi:MAG: preprotein translocase subunit SecE [Armatimonadetes bacterium]|nr:preprotein translocase subunit SecE [Armatimonadota bacterium]MDW8028040.1 preprotein translocase subunit SecE [Armatimonadota bacterium]